MTDDRYKTAMDAIGFAAQMLAPQARQYENLIEAERAMHSHLHITDPTLYRAALHSDALRQQLALAKAALAFLTAVETIRDEIAPAEG